MTILLDLPAESGLRRQQEQGGHQPDRLEQEDITFHTRVRDGYLDFAARDPERYHVIDAGADPDAVAAEALSVTLVRASAKGIRKVS
jgi:dTMP kinase